MASTVRSLSNHYDILRVPAAASGDEIVEAFAAEMRAARLRPDIPVARLAELSVAYETLRDPAKRLAYDSSLGLDRTTPKPAVPSSAPGEARVAAFIAASLRDPVKPAETQATPDPVPTPAPQIVETHTDPGGLLIDRNRATIGAGAVGLVVLALAVSLPEKNLDRLPASNEPAQAVTVGLPPAAPVQDFVVPPQPSPAIDRKAPVAPKPTAEPRPEPQSVDRQAAAPAESAALEKPADPLAPLAQPASTAPAESAPADTASPNLPLPKATIARTIERIGYACGSVASAAAVDGASGTFKIICSSGDSYRAAPVGGRYHFRRWDKR